MSSRSIFLWHHLSGHRWLLVLALKRWMCHLVWVCRYTLLCWWILFDFPEKIEFSGCIAPHKIVHFNLFQYSGTATRLFRSCTSHNSSKGNTNAVEKFLTEISWWYLSRMAMVMAFTKGPTQCSCSLFWMSSSLSSYNLALYLDFLKMPVRSAQDTGCSDISTPNKLQGC